MRQRSPFWTRVEAARRQDTFGHWRAMTEDGVEMIRQALSRSEGNISNTAKLLGISRPTLYDLLKQYDLSA